MLQVSRFLRDLEQRVDPGGEESSQTYPCFEHLTLMDLLDNQGIPWRYYTPSAGVIWTAPNAIHHLRFGPDWKNVIINPVQLLSGITSGHLASVSWVIPTGQASDHIASNKGLGPSWVAPLVNTIGESSYWDDTAIFIIWDDWGGWFDHVSPPAVILNNVRWGSGYVYGFRVPLIVVSPYAKRHYVFDVTHDFDSILKFVEVTFDLPSLGYADAYADDLSDCFDFKSKAHPFRRIPAPYDASYFLTNTEPPTDPDDERTGCPQCKKHCSSEELTGSGSVQIAEAKLSSSRRLHNPVKSGADNIKGLNVGLPVQELSQNLQHFRVTACAIRQCVLLVIPKTDGCDFYAIGRS